MSSEKNPVLKALKVETTSEVDVETVSQQTDAAESIWQSLLGVGLVGLNLAVRLYCGLYMIISDCDETFNYWEPLNMIARGFGKQTWEYSPGYAIRSYVYLIPYYVFTFPLRDFIHITGDHIPAYAHFYFIRIVLLCGFTSFAELALFRSVRRNFSSYVANWFLLFSTVSAGMSHAGVALLPSSFAMGWITLGTASALDVLTMENSSKSVRPSVIAITSFLVSGIVGWPFTLVLGLPFGLFTLGSRFQTDPLVKIVLLCTVLFVTLITIMIGVDSYIYGRKMLFVPANIFLYNVFALEDEGPDIFGTEPFSYYVKNLILNFNVVAPLAYAGIVVNPFLSGKNIRCMIGISIPLFIWTFVFGSQPHKEERFLYPVYPLITLSGAVFISSLFQESKKIISCRWLVRGVSVLSMLFVGVISLLRVVNLVENYSAPLTTALVFDQIASKSTESGIKNVCIGREWYHFPASFYLPDNYRLRFIPSGFDGLLPGDFPENLAVAKAAPIYPTGMNSKNIFSPEKVVDLEVCDFIIDNSSPVNESLGEIQFVSRVDNELVVREGWKLISDEKIINPDGAHGGVGKFVYIPAALRTYVPYDVEYMDYCVLQKDK